MQRRVNQSPADDRGYRVCRRRSAQSHSLHLLSRKDMAFSDKLEAALKARGFEPLIDRSEIYALEDWWKRIEALICRADTVGSCSRPTP